PPAGGCSRPRAVLRLSPRGAGARGGRGVRRGACTFRACRPAAGGTRSEGPSVLATLHRPRPGQAAVGRRATPTPRSQAQPGNEGVDSIITDDLAARSRPHRSPGDWVDAVT